jgi:hypothetical protein
VAIESTERLALDESGFAVSHRREIPGRSLCYFRCRAGFASALPTSCGRDIRPVYPPKLKRCEPSSMGRTCAVRGLGTSASVSGQYTARSRAESS